MRAKGGEELTDKTEIEENKIRVGLNIMSMINNAGREARNTG